MTRGNNPRGTPGNLRPRAPKTGTVPVDPVRIRMPDKDSADALMALLKTAGAQRTEMLGKIISEGLKSWPTVHSAAPKPDLSLSGRARMVNDLIGALQAVLNANPLSSLPHLRKFLSVQELTVYREIELLTGNSKHLYRFIPSLVLLAVQDVLRHHRWQVSRTSEWASGTGSGELLRVEVVEVDLGERPATTEIVLRLNRLNDKENPELQLTMAYKNAEKRSEQFTCEPIVCIPDMADAVLELQSSGRFHDTIKP